MSCAASVLMTWLLVAAPLGDAAGPVERTRLAPVTPKQHHGPGLHLVAPFNDILGRELAPELAADMLSARLPLFSGRRAIIAAKLASRGDRETYYLEQHMLGYLLERLTVTLGVNRAIQVYLLPRELGPLRPPLLSPEGLLVVATDSQRVMLMRLITGVALSHPDLPHDASLLSTIVRYGASSRYLAYIVMPGLDLSQSPLVDLSPAEVRSRLPDLLAFALHYAHEPESSFGDGWLSDAEIEILGWLATSAFTDWGLLAGGRISASRLPSSRPQAPRLHEANPVQAAWRDLAWSALRTAADEVLALHSSEGARLLEAKFDLGYVESRGRRIDGRSMLVLTHREGLSLLRYQRFDPDRDEHYKAFFHVAPELVDLLLRRLEEIDVVSIDSNTSDARADVVLHSFHLDGDIARIAYDHYGSPSPGSAPGLVQEVLRDILRALGLR